MALEDLRRNNMLAMLDNLNVNLFLMNDIKMTDLHHDQLLTIEIHWQLSLLVDDDEENALENKARVRKRERKFSVKKK
jgi:hypothetical protein